jgi:hypothetical protein
MFLALFAAFILASYFYFFINSKIEKDNFFFIELMNYIFFMFAEKNSVNKAVNMDYQSLLLHYVFNLSLIYEALLFYL